MRQLVISFQSNDRPRRRFAPRRYSLSGEPPSSDPDEVERTLGARIDLLLDAGRAPGGRPSTIVDVTGSAPRLVRAGALAWDEVQACVSRA